MIYSTVTRKECCGVQQSDGGKGVIYNRVSGKSSDFGLGINENSETYHPRDCDGGQNTRVNVMLGQLVGGGNVFCNKQWQQVVDERYPAPVSKLPRASRR